MMIDETSTGAKLDLADIQGNILTAYGKQGFPKGRFITLHVHNAEAGRQFLRELFEHVTTALRWPSSKDSAPRATHFMSGGVPQRPSCTVNVAFTFWGLFALQVPVRTLDGMPPDFMDGMRVRAPILGDNLPEGALDRWDAAWRGEDQPMSADAVHMLVMLNCDMNPSTGEPVPALEEKTDLIRRLCDESDGGVTIVAGHGPTGAEFQDLSAVCRQDPDTGLWYPTAEEHFGFTDGIGDPVFEGQYTEEAEARRLPGNGKLRYETKGKDTKAVWEPLATGEFLLGYRDEASELPVAAAPNIFSRNGTFMAYRKLYENTQAFADYIDTVTPEFGRIYGIDDPVAARATLMAKFAGRWEDGVPLSIAPTYEDWQQFNRDYPGDERYGLFSDFDFKGDEAGTRCPASSHIRRVNPRDALGPRPEDGSILTNRRRILRRGLPYTEPAGDGRPDEQGIIMLVLCANLQRQFEFVQQQWLNYGMDNDAGNDTCPLLGVRPDGKVKFVIPGDGEKGQPPFFCTNLPQFVETRGGAYFFVPSMSALKMIAQGMIDPT